MESVEVCTETKIVSCVGECYVTFGIPLLSTIELEYFKNNSASLVDYYHGRKADFRILRSANLKDTSLIAGKNMCGLLSGEHFIRDCFKYVIIRTEQKALSCGIVGSHGVVISKGGVGALLIGANGAGKTLLSLVMNKVGYNIRSGDYCFIDVNSGKVISGSKALVIRKTVLTNYFPELSKDSEIQYRVDGRVDVQNKQNKFSESDSCVVKFIIKISLDHREKHQNSFFVKSLSSNDTAFMNIATSYYYNTNFKSIDSPCRLLDEKELVLQRFDLSRCLIGKVYYAEVYGNLEYLAKTINSIY